MKTCEVCKGSMEGKRPQARTCGTKECQKELKRRTDEKYRNGVDEPRLAMDEYFWSLVRPAPKAKERSCLKCRRKIAKRTFNGDLAYICGECKRLNANIGVRAEYCY